MLSRTWIVIYPFLFYYFVFAPIWANAGSNLWAQMLQADFSLIAVVIWFAVFCMSVAILFVPFAIVYYTLKFIQGDMK